MSRPARLEYHHRLPFGHGGDHSPEVLCLMCPTHNALIAEADYGAAKMARHREGAKDLAPRLAGAGRPT